MNVEELLKFIEYYAIARTIYEVVDKFVSLFLTKEK